MNWNIICSYHTILVIQTFWNETKRYLNMDVGETTSTTSMDVVKVRLEKPVGLELEKILYRKKKNFFWKPVLEEKFHWVLFEMSQKKPLDGSFFLFMKVAKNKKSQFSFSFLFLPKTG